MYPCPPYAITPAVFLLPSFCLVVPSAHFLQRATLTQGTVIKCASISLAPLQLSSFPVPGPVYPVSRPNTQETDSRPRPQSNFQSPQRQGFILGLNISKHSSRAIQMNPKRVGQGLQGLTASLRQSLRSSSKQASSLASRALCCLRTALVSSFIGETGLSGPAGIQGMLAQEL